jgi:hypothetical protein
VPIPPPTHHTCGHQIIQHDPTFDKHITLHHDRKEWNPCSLLKTFIYCSVTVLAAPFRSLAFCLPTFPAHDIAESSVRRQLISALFNHCFQLGASVFFAISFPFSPALDKISGPGLLFKQRVSDIRKHRDFWRKNFYSGQVLAFMAIWFGRYRSLW